MNTKELDLHAEIEAFRTRAETAEKAMEALKTYMKAVYPKTGDETLCTKMFAVDAGCNAVEDQLRLLKNKLSDLNVALIEARGGD